MEIIQEELVEEIWEELTDYTSNQASFEMDRMSRKQPHLLGYMIELLHDVDQEVKELAIYLFFVVCKIFEESMSEDFREVTPEEVIECHEANEKLIESLQGSHDKFIERIAKVQISAQPNIIKYIVDTLMETPDESDSVDLSEEDIGYLFILLKTVVDVLNHAGK